MTKTAIARNGNSNKWHPVRHRKQAEGVRKDTDFFVTLYIAAQRRCAGKTKKTPKMSGGHRFTTTQSLHTTPHLIKHHYYLKIATSVTLQ